MRSSIFLNSQLRNEQCLSIAVLDNRNELYDWLKTHYECEEVSLGECLKFYTIEAFTNTRQTKTLKTADIWHAMCNYGFKQIAEMLIERGEKVSTSDLSSYFSCVNDV